MCDHCHSRRRYRSESSYQRRMHRASFTWFSASITILIVPAAIDLLTKMLAFDPSSRVTVLEALEHPWLASYHDVDDEPSCPHKYEKWRMIEKLETLEEFRTALWNEIEDYRKEVRGMHLDLASSGITAVPTLVREPDDRRRLPHHDREVEQLAHPDTIPEVSAEIEANGEISASTSTQGVGGQNTIPLPRGRSLVPPTRDHSFVPTTPTDPVMTYARRSSILQPSRAGSTYTSPQPPYQVLSTSITDGPLMGEPATLSAGNLVAFPSHGHGPGYVIPARSRTGSVAGGEVTRKLLRTLSTVSIHESFEGLPGGLAGIAPIGKYIVQKQTTEADAPPSEMPRDFGMNVDSEKDTGGEKDEVGEGGQGKEEGVSMRKGKFHLDSA